MTIYIAFFLTEPERALLQASTLPSDTLLWKQDLPETQQQEALLRAEVIFGNPPLGWVENSRQLRWLQLYSAGIDPYQQLRMADHAFTVTNLRNFFGQPVAETAVAGILSLYRKLDELARLQSRQQWVGGKLRPTMRLLQGSQVIILGAGAIGTTTQRLLEGFSCQVQLVSRSSTLTLNDLDDLLPQADIVLNCLPQTTETTGVINAQRLALMKKNAIFVNVGRGSVVDEEALIQALQQGSLGGAVLDVSDVEPLPTGHPLWTCPNVLLTQHTGGGYDAEGADKVRLFVQNLRRYRANEPLLNVVDLERGY